MVPKALVTTPFIVVTTLRINKDISIDNRSLQLVIIG
jgi:hypothetical protein